MRNKHTTHKNIDKHSRKGTRKRIKDSGNSGDGLSSQYSRASSGTIGSKVKSHKRIPKAISRRKSRKNVGVFRGGGPDEILEELNFFIRILNSNIKTLDRDDITFIEYVYVTYYPKHMAGFVNKTDQKIWDILYDIKKHVNYDTQSKEKMRKLSYQTLDEFDVFHVNLSEKYKKIIDPPSNDFTRYTTNVTVANAKYVTPKDLDELAGKNTLIPSRPVNPKSSKPRSRYSKAPTKLLTMVDNNRNDNYNPVVEEIPQDDFEDISQDDVIYLNQNGYNANFHSKPSSTNKKTFDVPIFTAKNTYVNTPLPRDSKNNVNIPQNTSYKQEDIITPDNDTSSTSKDIITPDNDTSSTLEDRVISLSEVEKYIEFEKYIQKKIKDTNNSIHEYKSLNRGRWVVTDSISNIIYNLEDKLYELQKLEKNIKNIVQFENKEPKLKEKLEDKYTEELKNNKKLSSYNANYE